MGLEIACSNPMTPDRLDLLSLDKAVSCNGKKFIKLGVKGVKEWYNNNV